MWRKVVPSQKLRSENSSPSSFSSIDERVAVVYKFAAESEAVCGRHQVVAADFYTLAPGEAVVLDDVLVGEAGEGFFHAFH